MKKNIIKFLSLFVLLLVVVSCGKTKNESNTLTVYAYDSFAGDWGPANDIIEEFEKETSIKVNLIGCGSAQQMYGRFVFEGKKTEADVLIGLSDNMKVDQDSFLSWEPECKNDLIPYSGDKLIPFDYGYFAFLKNSKYKFNDTPTSLEELLHPEYKNRFALIDPRTSSVGLGLLKWTILSMGEEKAFDWWQKACKNALTTSDSWSSAYGIFTEAEVPFVISYSSSPVYHRFFEDNYDIEELPFDNGHIKTYEYLAINKNTENTDAAKKFCNFVLTKGQEKIAVANSLFPSNTKTELPEAFNSSKSLKAIDDNLDFVSKQDYYLQKWAEKTVL